MVKFKYTGISFPATLTRMAQKVLVNKFLGFFSYLLVSFVYVFLMPLFCLSLIPGSLKGLLAFFTNVVADYSFKPPVKVFLFIFPLKKDTCDTASGALDTLLSTRNTYGLLNQ